MFTSLHNEILFFDDKLVSLSFADQPTVRRVTQYFWKSHITHSLISERMINSNAPDYKYLKSLQEQACNSHYGLENEVYIQET